MIGILDIQGSVEEHAKMLSLCGERPVLVKLPSHLEGLRGLIIPGGESTVIGDLMEKYGLKEIIERRAREKSLAIWGTCAGAILLAKKIVNDPPRGALKLMDIEVARNAYGRQMDSFEAKLKIPVISGDDFNAVFIRAPRIRLLPIRKAFSKAKILAKYGAEPVMVEEENLLATTFHPELTKDPRIHKYFISLADRYAKKGR